MKLLTDILIHLPAWSIGIGFLISISSLIILFWKGKASVKTKSFSIQSERKNLYEFFRKVIETTKSIDLIEYNTRLNEQISYTKDKIEEIREVVVKTFREAVSEKCHFDNIANHPAVKTFESLIFEVLTMMKREMRERFREMLVMFPAEDNETCQIEKIQDEFELYKKRISGLFIQDAKDQVKNKWIMNDWISEHETGKKIVEKQDELLKIIKNVIDVGMQIQLKYQRKINALRKELDDYMKTITE